MESVHALTYVLCDLFGHSSEFSVFVENAVKLKRRRIYVVKYNIRLGNLRFHLHIRINFCNICHNVFLR